MRYVPFWMLIEINNIFLTQMMTLLLLNAKFEIESYHVPKCVRKINFKILELNWNLINFQRFLIFQILQQCVSSQRLTCQEENKLIISRAQDDRFQCQTNLTMESWETIGRGKVKNILKQFTEFLNNTIIKNWYTPVKIFCRFRLRLLK